MMVNAHAGHEPGEHWLALILDEDGGATFFNSLGSPLDFRHYPNSILKFLENRCETILYHTRQLQHFLSMAFLQHCVYYLCHRACGLSIENMLSLYQDDVRN